MRCIKKYYCHVLLIKKTWLLNFTCFNATVKHYHIGDLNSARSKHDTYSTCFCQSGFLENFKTTDFDKISRILWHFLVQKKTFLFHCSHAQTFKSSTFVFVSFFSFFCFSFFFLVLASYAFVHKNPFFFDVCLTDREREGGRKRESIKKHFSIH
jgi:hypothetical protein